MSKNNKDFFNIKKSWSIIKDKLLDVYLSLYFSKVLFTKKPIVYIDCFSGPGKFKDGSDGSPLIALKRRKEALSNTNTKEKNPIINAYFIDQYHADDLTDVINDLDLKDNSGEILAIKGTYETVLPNLLSKFDDVNIFLYLDPFGIKSLNFRVFIDVCAKFKGKVELLLNFNTFGFFREACRILGLELDLLPDDDDEYITEPDCDLDDIAGGNYWRAIIQEYKRNNSKDKTIKAEDAIAKEYKKRLSKSYGGAFDFVLDIPIKYKNNPIPKYRMIYATNHPDGCTEMADNMIRRANELNNNNLEGQISFFPVDAEQNIQLDKEFLKQKVIEFINKTLTIRLISINVFLSNFICENGILCPSSVLIDILKKLEEDGSISVKRDPPITRAGRPCKAWSKRKDLRIYISKG